MELLKKDMENLTVKVTPEVFELLLEFVKSAENVKKSHLDKVNGVTGRDMKTVYQYDKDLIFITSYHSTSYAAKQIGVSQTNISKRCLKYPKMSCGFYWTYTRLH